MFYKGGNSLDENEEKEKSDLIRNLKENAEELKTLDSLKQKLVAVHHQKNDKLDEVKKELRELEKNRVSRKQLESRKKTCMGKLAKAKKNGR